MKLKRHSKIIELIEKYDIETQEDLVEQLEKSGFKVTQATVSRDIHELNLIKTADQKYALISRDANQISEKFINVFCEAVLSINGAQNIIVIKTISGMAMAVGAALDAMGFQDIVGSIAGDDTIFCVVRDENMAESLMLKLKSLRKK